MITQRSALLGFVGVCFYLIAMVNTLPAYYYALTWLAVGLLASSLGIALLSLVGLECDWSTENDRGLESVPGEEENSPLINFSVANRGSFSKTGLVLEAHFLLAQSGSGPGERAVQRFVVEALAPGTSLQTRLPLRTLERGVWELTHLRIVGSDVLGLFRTARKIPVPAGQQPARFIVGPALITVALSHRARYASAGRRQGDLDSRYRVGQGEELRGIRPYQPGDDLRRVHWKSTARAGELVVKEHHHRGTNSSVVVWDGALGTDWGHGAATEWGLRLTLALLRCLAQTGSPCDLMRLDNQPFTMEAGTRVDALMPLIVEKLAAGSAKRTRPLLEMSGTLPGDYQEIFLVSASVSPDVLSLALKCTSRRIKLHVLALNGASFQDAATMRRFGGGDPEQAKLLQPVYLQEKSGDSVVKELNASATAFKALAAELRSVGAHVVECGPENMKELEDYGPALRRILRRLLDGEAAAPAAALAESGLGGPNGGNAGVPVGKVAA